MDHAHFIRRCLELAERGRGRVGNGAMVGAVLVRDGQVIAEGFHAGYGMPHAEAELINKFDQKFQKEDAIYVNLEPCNHQGKTPPCTQAIIAAGIRTVVFGMEDPDTRVAGSGVRVLREAGLTVIGPVLPEVCRRFNRGYVSLREQGRPWVTLKQARTRSGETTNPDGSRRKITTAAQDTWSHTWLRAKHDAILVGAGTVVSDDPSLTVRFTERSSDVPQPYRIILDPRGRIPADAAVRSDAYASRTIIVPADAASESSINLAALLRKLSAPDGAYHGISSLLVEGGAKTWAAFRSAGLVDEEVTLTQNVR